MNRSGIGIPFLVGCILVFSMGGAHAQEQDFDSVEIGTIEVAQGIYMLTGSGGNIGVSAGEDGVFLIDDQYAPLTEKIRQAVAEISPEPIRFLLNTHWHGDHTGGNENLGKAGVVIVAHENVRARMSSEQFLEFFGSRVPPSPKAALPAVTFSDAVTFYFNGEEIHVAHFPPAHTDGDSVIQFRQANVIHTGDLFTYEQYPFIDVASGGSINGLIRGAKRLLSLVDMETRLIPGHGPLGDRSRLQEFHDMLVTILNRIVAGVEAGQSLDEIVQREPAREFDAKWGQKFLSSEQFVRLVHSSLY
jgi:glyoxylase-like metal-dependent hydrolase (beta-lactamase superfamily II)